MASTDSGGASSARTSLSRRDLGRALTGLAVVTALIAAIVREATDNVTAQRLAFGVTVVVSIVALYLLAVTMSKD
jgi:hypothetical protein